MSTGLNCEFLEIRDDDKDRGEWFYILEHGDAPKQSWDWRDYATANGPFPSEERANEHLHRHHANPGGYCRTRYTRAEVAADPVLAKLVAAARRSSTDPGHYTGGHYRLS